MEDAPLKLIVGEPAALLGRNLLVADLHFGFDRDQGFSLSDLLLRRLLDLAAREKVRRIVVLGDFKDVIIGNPRHALYFSRRISEHFDLLVLKGNHDGKIEEIVEAVPFLRWGSYGLFHGHTRVPEELLSAQRILCGHFHPSLGTSPEERVWLRFGKFLVFPSFNPGLAFNLFDDLGNLGERFKTVSAYLINGGEIRLPLGESNGRKR